MTNLGVNFIHVRNCWIVELFLVHLKEIIVFPFTFKCGFPFETFDFQTFAFLELISFMSFYSSLSFS